MIIEPGWGRSPRVVSTSLYYPLGGGGGGDEMTLLTGPGCEDETKLTLLTRTSPTGVGSIRGPLD